MELILFFFFSSRRRHTRSLCDWSSDVLLFRSFALELMTKQEHISYLALYDPLTDLPNRTLFQEHLTEAIEVARRDRGQLALIITDLERFKAINDTLGHQVGDRLLRMVAGRLRDAAGELGRVSRLGSNVFGVMFPKVR